MRKGHPAAEKELHETMTVSVGGKYGGMLMTGLTYEKPRLARRRMLSLLTWSTNSRISPGALEASTMLFDLLAGRPGEA